MFHSSVALQVDFSKNAAKVLMDSVSVSSWELNARVCIEEIKYQ